MDNLEVDFKTYLKMKQMRRQTGGHHQQIFLSTPCPSLCHMDLIIQKVEMSLGNKLNPNLLLVVELARGMAAAVNSV